MSPDNTTINKRSIDCISSTSTGNEINNKNETWNTETKNKIQKLNNLNLNHLLSSSSQSHSQSQTQTLGLNIGRNSHSSAPSLQSSNSSLKSLIGNSSSTTTTTKNGKTTTAVVKAGIFMATFPRRSSAPALSMVIPVLSPCTYMTISLQNKKIKPRIDSFSIEQALFFEPYQESTIKMELLQALRSSNLDQLKSYQEVKNVEKQQQQQEQEEKKKQEKEENEKKKISNEAACDENGVITDDETHQEHKKKKTIADLRSCNQFGENLLHLACRMGIHLEILEFLIEEAQVKLNVRDRFGRTPLHNACMSALPNFNNIDYLISTQPRMVLFEDDNGKIPFDLIPQRCYERWTRFLSEQNILQRVVSAELDWDTKKGDMFE